MLKKLHEDLADTQPSSYALDCHPSCSLVNLDELPAVDKRLPDGILYTAVEPVRNESQFSGVNESASAANETATGLEKKPTVIRFTAEEMIHLLSYGPKLPGKSSKKPQADRRTKAKIRKQISTVRPPQQASVPVESQENAVFVAGPGGKFYPLTVTGTLPTTLASNVLQPLPKATTAKSVHSVVSRPSGTTKIPEQKTVISRAIPIGTVSQSGNIIVPLQPNFPIQSDGQRVVTVSGTQNVLGAKTSKPRPSASRQRFLHLESTPASRVGQMSNQAVEAHLKSITSRMKAEVVKTILLPQHIAVPITSIPSNAFRPHTVGSITVTSAPATNQPAASQSVPQLLAGASLARSRSAKTRVMSKKDREFHDANFAFLPLQVSYHIFL